MMNPLRKIDRRHTKGGGAESERAQMYPHPVTTPKHTVDQVGLCKTCRHAAAITTASGSIFYRCSLSETDSRFRKYPLLPVIRCTGYQPKTS